jgi:hypothetical protein
LSSRSLLDLNKQQNRSANLFSQEIKIDATRSGEEEAKQGTEYAGMIGI